MKGVRIVAAVLILSLTALNSAKADCGMAYESAVQAAKDKQTFFQESGLVIGFISVFAGAVGASQGDSACKFLLVGGLSGGVAIATAGTIANSPHDLLSGGKLIDEAQKGNGLMIQMLRSELKNLHVELSTEQLASEITNLNQRDVLCPTSAGTQMALGYSAIRKLISKSAR